MSEQSANPTKSIHRVVAALLGAAVAGAAGLAFVLVAGGATDDAAVAYASIDDVARQSQMVVVGRLMDVSPPTPGSDGQVERMGRVRPATQLHRGDRRVVQPAVRYDADLPLRFGESYVFFLSTPSHHCAELTPQCAWWVVDAWEATDDGSAAHPGHGTRDMASLLDEVTPLLAPPQPMVEVEYPRGRGGVIVSDLYAWRTDPWFSARDSDLIALVEVVSVGEPRWADPNAPVFLPSSHNTIFRVMRADVERAYRGRASADRQEIVLLGGTIDGFGISYQELHAVPGSQLLLFLREWEERDHPGMRPYLQIVDYRYVDGDVAIAEHASNRPLREVIAAALAPAPPPTRSPRQ